MTREPTGRPPRRGHRLLRGLRAQLLLWTILPLAVVLVVLSLAGVARHRQAMTRLVEDRDRGLTTAEANRLGREIAQQIASLTRLAATLPAVTTSSSASSLPEDPAGSYARRPGAAGRPGRAPGGLAGRERLGRERHRAPSWRRAPPRSANPSTKPIFPGADGSAPADRCADRRRARC